MAMSVGKNVPGPSVTRESTTPGKIETRSSTKTNQGTELKASATLVFDDSSVATGSAKTRGSATYSGAGKGVEQLEQKDSESEDNRIDFTIAIKGKKANEPVYNGASFFVNQKDIQKTLQRYLKEYESVEIKCSQSFLGSHNLDDRPMVQQLFEDICEKSRFKGFDTIVSEIQEDINVKDFCVKLEDVIIQNGNLLTQKKPSTNSEEASASNSQAGASQSTSVFAKLACCCPSFLASLVCCASQPDEESALRNDPQAPTGNGLTEDQKNEIIQDVQKILKEAVVTSPNECGSVSPSDVVVTENIFDGKSWDEIDTIIQVLTNDNQLLENFIKAKQEAQDSQKTFVGEQEKLQKKNFELADLQDRIDRFKAASGSASHDLTKAKLIGIFKEYVDFRDGLQNVQDMDSGYVQKRNQLKKGLEQLLNPTPVILNGEFNIDQAIANATGDQKKNLELMNLLNQKTLEGVDDGRLELKIDLTSNEFTHTLNDPTYDRVIAALQGLDLNNEDLRDALVVLFNQFKADGVADEYTGDTVFNPQTQVTTAAVQPVPKFTFSQTKLAALKAEVGALDLAKLKKIHNSIKGDGDQALAENETVVGAKAAVNAILAKDVGSQDALQEKFDKYLTGRDEKEAKKGDTDNELKGPDIEDQSTPGSPAVTTTTYSFKPNFKFDFIKNKLIESVATTTQTHALPAAATDLIAKLNEIEGIDVTDGGVFKNNRTQQATTTFKLTIPQALREKLQAFKDQDLDKIFPNVNFDAVVFDSQLFTTKDEVRKILELFGIEPNKSEWSQQSNRTFLALGQLNKMIGEYHFLGNSPLYDSLKYIRDQRNQEPASAESKIKSVVDDLIGNYATTVLKDLTEDKLSEDQKQQLASLEEKLSQKNQEFSKLYKDFTRVYLQLKGEATDKNQQYSELVDLVEKHLNTIGKISSDTLSVAKLDVENQKLVLRKLCLIAESITEEDASFDKLINVIFSKLFSNSNLSDLKIQREKGQAWLSFNPPQEAPVKLKENQDYGFYYLKETGDQRLQFMSKDLAEHQKQVDFSIVFKEPSSTGDGKSTTDDNSVVGSRTSGAEEEKIGDEE